MNSESLAGMTAQNTATEDQWCDDVQVSPDLRRVVGMRIHRVRRDLGFSQMQFGFRLHATYVMVSRWESGRYPPNAVELFAISKMSGRPLDWFFRE